VGKRGLRTRYIKGTEASAGYDNPAFEHDSQHDNSQQGRLDNAPEQGRFTK